MLGHIQSSTSSKLRRSVSTSDSYDIDQTLQKETDTEIRNSDALLIHSTSTAKKDGEAKTLEGQSTHSSIALVSADEELALIEKVEKLELNAKSAAKQADKLNAKVVASATSLSASTVECIAFNNGQFGKAKSAVVKKSTVTFTTEKLTSIFSRIDDVSSLVERLSDSSDLSDLSLSNLKKGNAKLERIEIRWHLAAKMVSAFLSNQFLSANVIAEVMQLEPFMQEELRQAVRNKIQGMLDHIVDGVKQYAELEAADENEGLAALASLNNLRLITTNAGFISLKKDNLIKTLRALRRLLENVDAYTKKYREQLNISASQILAEIAVQIAKEPLNSEKFDRTLQRLFDYFKNLKDKRDPYLVYRAAYARQALIDIYAQTRDKSSKGSSFDRATDAEKTVNEDLAKQVEELRISKAGTALATHHVTSGRNEKSTSSEKSKEEIADDFSIAWGTQQTSSWYQSLRALDQIIAKRVTGEVTLSALKKYLDRPLVSEGKLFLWGIYERGVNLLLNACLRKEGWREVFNLLSPNFFDRKIQLKSLNTTKSLFRSVILPTDEDFAWTMPTKEKYSRQKLELWLGEHGIDQILLKDSITKFEELLSNRIFSPIASNLLTQHSKKMVLAEQRKRRADPASNPPEDGLHKIETQNSRLRFPRRLQWVDQTEKNIALTKYVKTDLGNRKVIYLIAYSMGMGIGSLTLKGESKFTQKGEPRKRSHSEPILLGTEQVGSIAIKGEEVLSLKGFTREYCTSTNEPCSGKRQQNCKEALLPELLPFFFANDYSGSDDAKGFKKKIIDHLRKQSPNWESQYESDYKSDEESEAEYDAFLVHSPHFVGKDLNKAKDRKQSVPVERLYAHLNGRAFEKRDTTLRLGDDRYFYRDPKRQIFADYACPGEKGYRASVVQEDNKRILALDTLDTKGKSKAKPISSAASEIEKNQQTFSEMKFV